MNLSQQRREESIKRIKEIRDFISHSAQDENAGRLLTYLSELEKEIKGKKYGLVFEEHREKIDETLENNLSVLTEQEDLYIDNGGQMNFLIEGDNLAALQLLLKTHRGKIDLIYIDPPYNTGNKDFIYDDDYVDKNDSFRHSKWISFMEKRLKLAKKLLSKRGCIFVSIADHEFSNLKLLMDIIFGEQNFLCDILWNSTKSVTNTAVVSVSHTYNFVYFREINYIIEHRTNFRIAETGEGFSNPDNDPRGLWKADPFQVGGWRPNQQYEIVNPNTGVVYRPNKGCSWKNDYKKYQELLADNRIVFGKNGTSGPQRKRFIGEAKERGRVVKTIWDDVDTTTNGTQELKIIFDGESPFSNPKPVNFIQRILELGSNSNSTVLDFFAGSGTTGHAVLKLNAEDGGTRRFILCTNNENNICRDITYERIKRVIDKEDYAASLKYFKIDFVRISERLYYEYADELLLHIRELVELENGVNFRNNSEIAIVLTDEELDAFMENRSALKACKALYVGHDVLINGRQSAALKRRKIAVNVIPQYYYEES